MAYRLFGTKPLSKWMIFFINHTLKTRLNWKYRNNPLSIDEIELKAIICNLLSMMTSSNGNIFHVTGPLCGEFTGPGEIPTQRPVRRNFDVLFDLRLNKRLSKQPWGWWFETPSWSLWRQRNAILSREEISYLSNYATYWGNVGYSP